MGAWNCHYYVRMILYYLSAVSFNHGSFLLWLTSQTPQSASPPALPMSLASGISSHNTGKGAFEHFSEPQLPTIAMLPLLCKIDCAILFQIHLRIADAHPCIFGHICVFLE